MRKLLIFIGLSLVLTARVFASETLTLGDGTSVSGDVVKTDDNAIMIHTTSDTYSTIQWGQLSQDSLKHLAENPKLKQYVEPFIEPTAAERPAKAPITVKPVTRMTLPEHPSIIGGLVGSSLGLFILLVIYAANLYAAFEVAIVRGKKPALVMGVAAVLPIIGPIIFMAQKVQAAPAAEELPPEEAAAPAPGAAPAEGQEDIQIVSASWQASQEEKKPQPQVFSRGKFTFNKRFVETKFAGFIGEPKGDAKTFSMSIKTLKDTVSVECIKQTGATEAIVETPNGQMTIAYTDIQEVVLTPKPA